MDKSILILTGIVASLLTLRVTLFLVYEIISLI